MESVSEIVLGSSSSEKVEVPHVTVRHLAREISRLVEGDGVADCQALGGRSSSVLP